MWAPFEMPASIELAARALADAVGREGYRYCVAQASAEEPTRISLFEQGGGQRFASLHDGKWQELTDE